MSKKLITIVVPVYNVENYLEQCIESLINQTYKEFNVIFVNDGSTDNSLSVLNKYCSENGNFSLINLETNVGGGKAKNIAIDKVETKYFTVVDSDDYVATNFIEEFIKIISEKDYDKVDIGANTFSDDSSEITKIANAVNAPWSKLYNTQKIKSLGIKFYEGKGTHDTPFSILADLLLENKTTHYDIVTYFYRLDRNDSVQSKIKNSKKYDNSIFYCYDYILDYLLTNNLEKHIKVVNVKYLIVFFYILNVKNNNPEILSTIRKYYKKINKYGGIDISLMPFNEYYGYLKSIYGKNIVILSKQLKIIRIFGLMLYLSHDYDLNGVKKIKILGIKIKKSNKEGK